MSQSAGAKTGGGKAAMKPKAQPARTSQYICDVKLIPRMRRYLENKSSTDPTDVESIVAYLQQTYPDYRRKKRSTFRHSVSRALDILVEDFSSSASDEGDVDILSAKRPKTHQQGKSGDAAAVSDDSDGSISPDGEYAEYQDSNAINSLVTNLYSNPSSGNASPAHPTSAQPTTNRKIGFVKCNSEPVINKHNQNQLDGLGYIDRGEDPPTPVNHSKLIESLPASPRLAHEGDVANDVPASRPVVITIGDDEGDSITEAWSGSAKVAAPLSPMNKRKDPQPDNSTRKKRKPSVSKAKMEGAAAGAVPPTPSKKKGAIDAVYSTTKFSQIGGNEKTIEEVQKLLLHMRYPQIYEQIGVTPPRGFLLHGPPGCGKTLMAHAIAGELELPFFKLAATELVSGVSGESEERVRNLFNKAAANAPCVLFIDEVDSITPKRETASKDMERRIVSQFLTCLDDLCERKDAHVLVIGATNRPDSLDPALRRAGRFDREISMGIPDGKARESILRVLCKDIRLADGFDFNSISHLTPGYVGADLSSLVREAAMLAVNRIFVSLESGVPDGTVREHSPRRLQSMETDNSNESAGRNIELQEEVSVKPNSLETITENGVAMETGEIVEGASSNHAINGSEIIEALSSSTPSLRNENSQPQSQSRPSQMISTTKSTADIGNWWKKLPTIPPALLKTLNIDLNDFLEAVKIVQPSAKREGFATVPDVTWDDIGALQSIREELQMAILAPVKYPEQFKSLGLNSPSGVLLAGPPGCGKTLLAKAIANESGINFISVKGPELINMYVGESEKAVRQVFQRARNSSPCVVFFDELDSLCPRRSLSGSDGGSSSRLVNQLLTEMDGLQERKQVFVMGATNRPDIIDPAILRPGRLDKTLHVGLPSLEDRTDILKTITRNCTKPVIEGVDLGEIAALPQCDGFSGADLTALIREASMAAMKEYISTEMKASNSHSSGEGGHAPIILTREHFNTALDKIKPSISAKDRERYQKMSAT